MFFSEVLLFPSGGRSNYRIPTMIATKNGTVVAVCNDRKDTLADTAQEVALVYAIKKPGEPWSEIKTLTGITGWDCWCGSTSYDEDTNTVFVFGGRNPQNTDEYGQYSEEEKAQFDAYRKEQSQQLGINIGGIVWKSTDEGNTWEEESFDDVLSVTKYTHYDGRVLETGGNTHGSSHGIQLKHGTHQGRLVNPSRFGVTMPQREPIDLSWCPLPRMGMIMRFIFATILFMKRRFPCVCVLTVFQTEMNVVIGKRRRLPRREVC